MSFRYRGVATLFPARLLLVPLVGLFLAAPAVHASLPTVEREMDAIRPSPSTPELKARGTRHVALDPKANPTEIRLANGLIFDTRDGEPGIAERLRADEAAAPDERISLLVQVQAPVQVSPVAQSAFDSQVSPGSMVPSPQ